MDEIEEKFTHCWQDYQSTLDMYSQEYYDAVVSGSNKTCMLPGGHKGKHDWGNNDEIVITFKDKKDNENRKSNKKV